MTDMDHPDYTRLADVLKAAYSQASRGKGKERHASDGLPFQDQPMSAINRGLGSIDGFLYQAAKKAQEARRLPYGRAQAELLGAINYLAGAVIALDTWAAGTLPKLVETPAPVPDLADDLRAAGFTTSSMVHDDLITVCCDKADFCTRPCVPRAISKAGPDGWIPHDGGECPVPKGTQVRVRLRSGSEYQGGALTVSCMGPKQWKTGYIGDPTPSSTDIVAYQVINHQL
jgi:hypothetical protein